MRVKRIVVLTCKQCNKEFEPRRPNDKRSFCSQECYAQSLIGNRPTNYSRVVVQCKNCGKEIAASPHRLKNRVFITCSAKCRIEVMKTIKGSDHPLHHERKIEVCAVCGKEHVKGLHMKKIGKYPTCSRKCSAIYKRQMGNTVTHVDVTCDGCGKTFQKKKHQAQKWKRNFCSYECMGKGFTGVSIPERRKQIPVTCCACQKVYTVPEYRAKADFQRFYCSKACRTDGIKKFHSGENSKIWNKNAPKDHRDKERQIPGYNEWRKDVYKRDNYECVACGKHGGNLCAHHILNYLDHPELRTNIDNGVTMCATCHKEFHAIHGKNYNTKEQLDAFIHNRKTVQAGCQLRLL